MNNPSLVVRHARLDDLHAIVEMRLALLREYGDHPLYANLRSDARDRALELFRAQLLSPSETMLLAERCGDIVGLMRCVESPSSPLLFPDRFCYVSSVYVRPAERRRGILRALLSAAEKYEKKGDSRSKMIYLNAFRELAAAQSGKGFTAGQAHVLIVLSKTL